MCVNLSRCIYTQIPETSPSLTQAVVDIGYEGGGGGRNNGGNIGGGRNIGGGNNNGGSGNNNGGGSNNNGGGGGINKSDRNVWSRLGRKFDTNGYCHLHGFKVEEDHNSGNCSRWCEGHDATATQMSTKGSKQWNKDWINGGPTK